MPRILLLYFLLFSLTAAAQVAPPILSAEDTTAMNEAMTAQLGNEVDPADSKAVNDSLSKAGYALKRLKDVIGMKKDILWSSSLSQSIKAFEDETYILVSPLMKVQGNGVLIGLVSKVGEINLFEPIDPYVNLYWTLKPVKDLEMPFTLELEIAHSDTLPDEIFVPIKTAMEAIYKDKTYATVEESGKDVTEATELFLEMLKDAAGDTYAPKYLFKVGNKEYRSGHEMSLYENKGNQTDTVVAIYLIDRISKEVVQNGITWDGAETEAYHAFIDKDSVGAHEITATIDKVAYTFKLTIIGDDVLSVISQSVLSVFEEALVDAMQVLVDSAQAKEDAYQADKALSEDLRKQMIAKIEQVCGTAAGTATTLYSSDSTAFIQEPIPSSIKTHSFLGKYINKANAEHLARMAFIFAWKNREVLAELTRDASKRAAFRDAVINDIGTLAADITMSLLTDDEKEVKEFLVDFIVEKVNATTTAQLNTK